MRRNVTRTGAVRQFRHQRYAIKTWVNKLEGVPAFIVGNGPSLSECNPRLIKDYFSIGINRCYYWTGTQVSDTSKIGFDPTVLFWQDISFWNTEYHNIHNLQAIKLCRDIADPKRQFLNFYLKGGGYKFGRYMNIFFGRGASMPLSVQCAVALGCRPLILLGCDCKRASDGRSSYWGENSFWLPHTLDACEKGLQFVQQECPVPVISCSNNSYFPRQDLPAVCKELGNKYALGRQFFVKRLLLS